MKRPLIIFTILLFFLGFSRVFAQQGETSKIIFVNLKLIKGHIYIEDFSVVKGRLKQPKNLSFSKGDIYYKVMNKTNEILFKSVIPDPSDIKYEYEDDQGLLSMKRVVLDSVNFAVRIPYNKSIHKVDFYKIQDISDQNQGKCRPDKSMGSIIIKMKEDCNEK